LPPRSWLPFITGDWAFGTPHFGMAASAFIILLPNIKFGSNILLSLLRGISLAAEHTTGNAVPETAEHCRKKVFYVASGIVQVMNVALLTSVSLMVLDQRPIQTGLTPAIASAAYTTYKIGAAAISWRRTNGTILGWEWSMIRLVDPLASVLVLQNTLIIAVDGSISPRMFRLVAVSSASILLLIFAVSAVWFVRCVLLYRRRP
jgi:hypothetical protein